MILYAVLTAQTSTRCQYQAQQCAPRTSILQMNPEFISMSDRE